MTRRRMPASWIAATALVALPLAAQQAPVERRNFVACPDRARHGSPCCAGSPNTTASCIS